MSHHPGFADVCHRNVEEILVEHDQSANLPTSREPVDSQGIGVGPLMVKLAIIWSNVAFFPGQRTLFWIDGLRTAPVIPVLDRHKRITRNSDR